MIKKNRIIHLQITEKPLLNTDQLNTTYSSDWIGNDNFTMTDVNIAQGIDYHLIPWDNRRIHLDTITGARDELVTGVRFGLNEGSIQLQVRFTSYDEVTGKLLNEHKWKKIDNLVREPILLMITKFLLNRKINLFNALLNNQMEIILYLVQQV